MERLTYKNYIEEYEVNFEKSSDKNWSIAESDTHIKVTGEPIEKLGQLEDVMEKFGIESVEELKNRLEPKIFIPNKLANLEELQQHLKDNMFVSINSCEPPTVELIDKDLQHQLAVKDKALELACEPRDDWGGREYSGTEYDNYYDYFIALAEKELKE